MSRARPRLSQHFLHDRRTAHRIAESLRAPPGARVLEIGPGEGALTGPLLERGYRVTAVELDQGLARKLAARWPDRDLEVLQGDILEHSLSVDEPWFVVGNLPYAITSPILFRMLCQAERVDIREMVVMVQREVGERLIAGPGTAAYGALTVMVRLAAEVESLFHVPPGAFRPPPKVHSMVVRLVPGGPESVDVQRRKRVREVVRAAFGQRRKQLRNSLRAGPWDLDENELREVEKATGIDLKRRAETLRISEWLDLEAALAPRRPRN